MTSRHVKDVRQPKKIRYSGTEWAMVVGRARAAGRPPARYVREISLGAASSICLLCSSALDPFIGCRASPYHRARERARRVALRSPAKKTTPPPDDRCWNQPTSATATCSRPLDRGHTHERRLPARAARTGMHGT